MNRIVLQVKDSPKGVCIQQTTPNKIILRVKSSKNVVVEDDPSKNTDDHTNSTKKRKVFTCSYCGMKFNDVSNMYRHRTRTCKKRPIDESVNTTQTPSQTSDIGDSQNVSPITIIPPTAESVSVIIQQTKDVTKHEHTESQNERDQLSELTKTKLISPNHKIVQQSLPKISAQKIAPQANPIQQSLQPPESESEAIIELKRTLEQIKEEKQQTNQLIEFLAKQDEDRRKQDEDRRKQEEDRRKQEVLEHEQKMMEMIQNLAKTAGGCVQNNITINNNVTVFLSSESLNLYHIKKQLHGARSAFDYLNQLIRQVKPNSKLAWLSDPEIMRDSACPLTITEKGEFHVHTSPSDVKTCDIHQINVMVNAVISNSTLTGIVDLIAPVTEQFRRLSDAERDHMGDDYFEPLYSGPFGKDIYGQLIRFQNVVPTHKHVKEMARQIKT